jgi:hypothetical protein
MRIHFNSEHRSGAQGDVSIAEPGMMDDDMGPPQATPVQSSLNDFFDHKLSDAEQDHAQMAQA